MVRSVGCALLLYLGFGLRELGVTLVIGQFAGNLLAMLAFRSVFPQMRLERQYLSLSLAREMWAYGVHSFVANVSNLLLNQGAPMVIGHVGSVAMVGFFTFPSKLLSYSVDAVTRIGLVTRSNVVEMQTKGDEESIYRLGIYLNRYCVTLFVPLVMFLLVYGSELLHIWVKDQAMAEAAGPLLPVIALTTMFAVAGQYNSTSMLYGLARHDRMAKGLLVEGLVGLLGIWLVLPHFGLMGVACVVGLLAVADRGILVPWLVCHALRRSFVEYMAGIYVRPLATAIPVLLAARAIKAMGVAGTSWPQLIGMGAFCAAGVFLPAFFTCMTREHRDLMLHSLGARVGMSHS
jgi:O-antigen/teichoic acid export membrane protein